MHLDLAVEIAKESRCSATATRVRRGGRGHCSTRCFELTRRSSQTHRRRFGQRGGRNRIPDSYLRRKLRRLQSRSSPRKTAIPLSTDHKLDREDEAAWIEVAGGKVIRWNGARVFGVLTMPRSIGDRYLKPSIIPDPEVTAVRRVKEEDCLILASDGVWGVMTDEEACEMARKRILLWYKMNAMAGDASLLRDERRWEGKDPACRP